MRLLHILNAIEYSGAETMIAGSAPDFAEHGFEVHCLSTGRVEGSYVATMRQAGVIVHHVPDKPLALFWLRLLALLLSERFDVVNVHRERRSFWLLLCARAARVPTVVRTVHSVFQLTGVRRLARSLQRRFADDILRVRFIFVGPSVARNERGRFGTVGHQIANYVDERRFLPARTAEETLKSRSSLGIAEDAFVLVSVGACADVKRHADIIRAVALLRHAGKPIEYLHAGQGPLQDEEARLTRVLDLERTAHFLGNVLDVRRVCVAADCFVMSSRYEGMSMSCVEAAACGLPVVAYDVPGLRDTVHNGVTGFLTQENPQAMARAIERLIVDPIARRAMGAAGRRRVLSVNSRATWMREHMLAYGESAWRPASHQPEQ